MDIGCEVIDEIFYDVSLNYLEIDFSDYYDPKTEYSKELAEGNNCENMVDSSVIS